jgi:hypothetical protein
MQHLLGNMESVIEIDGTTSIHGICLRPKSDVSLLHLEKQYEHFIRRMATIDFSSEFLAKVAESRRIDDLLMFTDLKLVNEHIRTTYMRGKDWQDVYSISEKIKGVNHKTLNSFAANILMPNLIFRLVTRHRSDGE